MNFEVHADCAACRVESAVAEVWDSDTACGRLGVPLTSRCRLCGHGFAGRASCECLFPAGCPACGSPLEDASLATHRCPACGAHAELDVETPPRPLADRADLLRALESWAVEEGMGSAADLLESSFVLRSVDDLHAAIARGETVETTLDVADLLFGSSATGGGGSAVVSREPAAPTTLRLPPPPSIKRYGGARDELYALASVAAADGDANAMDLAALARSAAARGLAPLPVEDVRVRRPGEVDPPPTLLDRERVLHEMFQMAWADGELDESELRVVRDYARSWGIDPERLAEWTKLYSFADAGRIERWFRRIGMMIFPEK